MTETINGMEQRGSLKLISASEIKPRAVRWLWYPFIPVGKVTILQGDPGDGKSTFMLELAARMTSGRPFPFAEEEQSGPQRVIYQTTEDDADDTVVPRFLMAGGDPNYLTFIDESEKVFQFTKANDTTVDMVIPAYGEGMMTLPELPVKGIILAKQDEYIAGVLPIDPTTGTASYSGKVKNAKGEEKTYVVSDFMVLYSGKDNDIMVTFKLKYGNMPFDFDGVFTGKKLLK